MVDLVISLSKRDGTWNYVAKLINEYSWDNIIILTDKFSGSEFKLDKKADFVIIDTTLSLVSLAKEIKEKLTGKIKGIEVAVNFVSGEGKEHMALMSALLRLGLGVRFFALKPEGLEEL